MPSASSDQSHQNSALARKISKIGEPRFDVFDKWKRTGRSQLDTAEEELPPGTLTIPKQIQDHENIQLKGEGFAAEWMSSNVRRTEDVTLVRIPAWAVEGVTMCIFPNVVVQTWPKTEYIPINRDDASCLRVADIREKGKGCLATRAIPRGELVARERALLLMPRTLTSPRQFVSAATSTMPPNQRDAFFALHNCRSADSGDVIGIISTNSFFVHGMPSHPVLYSAVFEIFSRVNHRYGTSLLSVRPRS